MVPDVGFRQAVVGGGSDWGGRDAGVRLVEGTIEWTLPVLQQSTFVFIVVVVTMLWWEMILLQNASVYTT